MEYTRYRYSVAQGTNSWPSAITASRHFCLQSLIEWFEVAILDETFPCFEQPQPKSIDVVHKKRVRKEGQSRKGRMEWGRKGSVPLFFLSPFVFPFVHFLMGNVNAFWFEVAPNWEKSHPRWQPRTTRAVARAMKTRATAWAERKKTQPDSTHRGIFLTGQATG